MEGPLVSDTTEFPAGAASAPGETPLGSSASSGNAAPEGSPAAKGRRRQGTGLSSLLLPELQQVAQQMGIAGTGRMRKSQLIAAIQEKQGGGGSAAPARGAKAAANGTASEVSAPRSASAGADAVRSSEQAAVEPQTATETNARSPRAGRNGARSSRTSGGQQLSFDQSAAGDGAPQAAAAAAAQTQTAPTAQSSPSAPEAGGESQPNGDGSRHEPPPRKHPRRGPAAPRPRQQRRGQQQPGQQWPRQ